MRVDVLPGARNLYDGMPAADDEDYMQNLIFKGGASVARYDPDETQSQDDRGAFTPSTFDQDQATFMRDQVGMDLDGFPLDHEFPEDYGQEEEDECDIEGGPLFEDKLANQAASAKQPKRKSKRTKADTAAKDKLLFECWRDIGQDPKRGGHDEQEGLKGGGAWRYKQEQINAFIEIQRRRLEMDAEKQAKMLEMEAEKQAKMLDIEAAKAKIKAKEVALASMMTGVDLMKVDLNTVSSRKRPWFEKKQANMLKFDEE
ncbi:Eyes absent-like protein 4 [Hordeum vulgare]|nr:Eyes absent-like protein 4 [Hordeum vulgare]